MNGVHDLGGVHGFGPVNREGNDEPFHSAWEKRVQAMGYIMTRTGVYNIDEFRYARESMPPAHYLAARYFERTLFAIEKNLLQKNVITEKEINARTEELREAADRGASRAVSSALPRLIERLLPLRRDLPQVSMDAAPRFRPGDRVVTQNLNPKGHTRLPRYARGKRGEVIRVHGAQVFPDTSAHGLGRHPQCLYSVRFEGRELWGDEAEPNAVVHLDLWESYLQPA